MFYVLEHKIIDKVRYLSSSECHIAWLEIYGVKSNV